MKFWKPLWGFEFLLFYKAWKSTGRKQKCCSRKAKSRAQNDGRNQLRKGGGLSTERAEGGSWIWTEQTSVCRAGTGTGIHI